MATTKITADQLIFRSSATGLDTVLDTYLQDSERGTLTLPQLMASIFDTNGTFTGTSIDPQFRTKPGFPDTLQYSVDGGTVWIDFATIPTGAGTGDMLASNNLNDVASVIASRTNLGLGALATLATVSNTEITNNTINPLTKLANGTPIRILGFDGSGAPAEITVSTGASLSANTLTAAPQVFSNTYTDTVDYTSGTGLPVGFATPTDPVDSKNLHVFFDGLQQNDGFTFNATTITFTAGIPLSVSEVRVRIIK